MRPLPLGKPDVSFLLLLLIHKEGWEESGGGEGMVAARSPICIRNCQQKGVDDYSYAVHLVRHIVCGSYFQIYSIYTVLPQANRTQPTTIGTKMCAKSLAIN